MQLTKLQQTFFDKVVDSKDNPGKFVIRGYAGTGKTVTLSKLVSDGQYNNILIATPTVAAMAVLKQKIPSSVDTRVKYTTLSKLTQIPGERVSVLNKFYNLDDEGMQNLEIMLTKLKVWNDDIVFKKTIYPRPTIMNPNPAPETKYFINEDVLLESLKTRFSNAAKMVGKVEPYFTYKDKLDISDTMKDFDLIIIDEMSMVSEDMMLTIDEAWQDLIDFKIKNGSNYGKYTPSIVLSGDRGQLPPVEGTLNQYFLEDEPDVTHLTELTEILRSTDKIANTAAEIRKGKSLGILSWQAPNAIQVEEPDLDTFIRNHRELLSTVDEALAYTNKDVFLLNKEIRSFKGFNDPSIQVAEKLMVTENSPANDYNDVPFANGEEQTVINIFTVDETIRKIENDKYYTEIVNKNDGSSTLVDEIKLAVMANQVVLAELMNKLGEVKEAFLPANMYKRQDDFAYNQVFETFKNLAQLNNGRRPLLRVAFGYARTFHKSQGDEWNTTFMWITGKDMWIMNKNDPKMATSLPYTGYTRAKETCYLAYKK